MINIDTFIYYPKPLHLQKAFKNIIKFKKIPFVSEKISNQVLSLPIHPNMKTNQAKYVSKMIKEFYE